MKYIFTQSANALVVTTDTESGRFPAEIKTYTGASADLANDRIYLREYGMDKQNFAFFEISTIDGVAPTDLEDAFEKLLVLIANFNGGGTAPYIPLAGTEIGNNIDGDIIFNDGIDLIWDGDSRIIATDFRFNTDNGITINSKPIASRGLIGVQDFTSNIKNLDYTQKKYVDERGAVSNATTVVLSASDLNTAYPNAKDGFRVFATDIISGGVLYHKIGASWVSQAITLVV